MAHTTMDVAKPRPKITRITLIIYIIISVILLILCMFLGGALDASVVNGKIDAAKIGNGFTSAMLHPMQIFKRLTNMNSYVSKMTFLGAMVIGIYALYKYSEEPKRLHRRGEEHGSARWGDEKEMHELADKAKEPHRQPAIRDGVPLRDEKGRFKQFIIDNNILLAKEVKLSLNGKQHFLNHNVLIVGGSGAGKTRFFAEPNVCQLNTSYVITDPKGEILADTGKMLEEAGYKVRVFNTMEMEYSNNYNPFEYVYDRHGQVSEENILKMIDVLFTATKGEGEKEDFWAQKGKELLEAIVFLLFEESAYNMEKDADGNLIPSTRDKSHLNFASAAEKMRKLRYPPKGSKKEDGYFLEKGENESDADFQKRLDNSFLCPLDKDFLELKKRNPDSLALGFYHDVRNAPEETGQSFLSSANVKTFMFSLSKLANLTCCDNIHLETLGEEKTALFLLIPATDSTYNFLPSILYTQLFDTLNTSANFKHGGRLPIPVRLIMDEFANLGEVPNFDKVIAYVRSLGVSLNVILQAQSQLKSRYEKTWETIIGCCDTFLFLGGQEESTLKSISERLGKETIDIKGSNRTRGKQSSTSENNSIQGRELLQVNELQKMDITKCIILMRSHNPFFATKYGIETHPNYSFLANAAKTEEEKKARTFDVSTIHAVTLEELAESYNPKSSAPSQKSEEQITQVTTQKDTLEMTDTVQSAFHQESILNMLREAPLLKIEEKIVQTDSSNKYGEPTKRLEHIDIVELYAHRKEEKRNESLPSPVTEVHTKADYGQVDAKPTDINIADTPVHESISNYHEVTSSIPNPPIAASSHKQVPAPSQESRNAPVTLGDYGKHEVQPTSIPENVNVQENISNYSNGISEMTGLFNQNDFSLRNTFTAFNAFN